MFINEVEHLAGLSKKSIRYYEENGLLTPRREPTNDYRIYTEDDLKKLKTIKFLRELGISIKDIKSLFQKELSLQDCMIEKINKLEQEEKNYQKIKQMCEDISKTSDSIETINLTTYFEEVNILNKEGFTMREVQTSKKKKIVAATLSSFIFSIIFIFMIIIISYFEFMEEGDMPLILYAFFMFVLIFPIIGVIYNLVIRIKEINGGEEDEASKY